MPIEQQPSFSSGSDYTSPSSRPKSEKTFQGTEKLRLSSSALIFAPDVTKHHDVYVEEYRK